MPCPWPRQRSPPAAAGHGPKRRAAASAIFPSKAPQAATLAGGSQEEGTAPAKFAQGNTAKSHWRSKGCVLRQTTRQQHQRQQTAPERRCRENAARPRSVALLGNAGLAQQKDCLAPAALRAELRAELRARPAVAATGWRTAEASPTRRLGWALSLVPNSWLSGAF